MFVCLIAGLVPESQGKVAKTGEGRAERSPLSLLSLWSARRWRRRIRFDSAQLGRSFCRIVRLSARKISGRPAAQSDGGGSRGCPELWRCTSGGAFSAQPLPPPPVSLRPSAISANRQCGRRGSRGCFVSRPLGRPEQAQT